MRSTVDSTTCIRNTCEAIVHVHLRQESRFFDSIWDAFWKQLAAKRVEDLLSPVCWNLASTSNQRGLAVLGQDGRAMDSFYVLGSITGAVITLLRMDKNVFLETAMIDAAIRDEATRLNAPAHVRRILESHATALLAEHFSAIDWKTDPKQGSGASLRIWVDWRDAPRVANSRAPDAQSAAISSDQVAKEFEKRIDDFMLYVDERTRLLTVEGKRGASRKNLWKVLTARQHRFLYLILKELRRQGSIAYKVIAEDVLRDEIMDPDRIKRAKNELKSQLGGIIDEILSTKKGSHLYTVEPIPYCWIRYEGVESALQSE